MFGISVYPYKEKLEDTLHYIDLAAKYGFKRVFTNLLLIDGNELATTIQKLKATIQRARKHNMEVIVDINPAVFSQLNINYSNLSYFKELGATGIRLDQSFDGLKESLMSYDQAGMDIELNISQDTAYVENILAYKPNKEKLIGCHNFYPQRYTGLDYDFFITCSAKYKQLGIRTAAFVNSNAANHGPHPHDEGICTLEMHRDMDIVVQAKHLIATELIDDIIIANAFASEQELRQLASLNQQILTLDVHLENISPIAKEIVIGNQHINRGDINSYSIRSTQVRVKYKKADIPKRNTFETLHTGDITIGNNSFGQYKAELNLVKKEMPNNDYFKNVVARVVDEEIFLIPYIKPWEKFWFRESEDSRK